MARQATRTETEIERTISASGVECETHPCRLEYAATGMRIAGRAAPYGPPRYYAAIHCNPQNPHPRTNAD
eukprot:458230-Lingulodinium_polyedra.AAC.1